MRKVSAQQLLASGVVIISTTYLIVGIAINKEQLRMLPSMLKNYRDATLLISPFPTLSPRLTLKPKPNFVPQLVKQPKPFTTPDIKPWGVAQKVDDVTYTIRVGSDSTMTTPQELLDALNNYRAVSGKSPLHWDDTLASYAQSRAQHFKNIGGTDKHEGFNAYLNNQDGFSQLGYRRLGENSYYGGPLNGVHLIEWVFAQSPGHNANQLDGQWTNVGIGVTDVSVNLNFGGEHI